MDKEQIEKTVKLINDYIKAYNEFDMHSLNELICDDIEYKNISHGELADIADGKIEFSLLTEQNKSIFSKREQKILHINLGKNSATVEVEFHAILAVGTITGLKAGQILSFRGSTNFNFKNGKISKIHDVS